MSGQIYAAPRQKIVSNQNYAATFGIIANDTLSADCSSSLLRPCFVSTDWKRSLCSDLGNWSTWEENDSQTSPTRTENNSKSTPNWFSSPLVGVRAKRLGEEVQRLHRESLCGLFIKTDQVKILPQRMSRGSQPGQGQGGCLPPHVCSLHFWIELISWFNE